MAANNLSRRTQGVLWVNAVETARIWNRHGGLIYASRPSAPTLISVALLRQALAGAQSSMLRGTALDGGRLLTVFQPIGAGTGAYEFDFSLRNADAAVADSSHTIWISLALGFSLLYLALYTMLQRVSFTLVQQNEKNKSLLAEVGERAHDTRMFFTVGQRLNAEENLWAVLDQVLNSACDVFGYRNTSILLVDEHDGYLHHYAGTGTLQAVAGSTCVALGQGIIGRAALERRQTYVPDVRRDPSFAGLSNGTLSQIALPLTVANRVIGVLNVESTVREAFRPRDLQLLAALADQAARAVQNARLVLDREDAQLAALAAMAAAIDARDPNTAGHSRRVRRYAMLIATELHYPPEDMLVLDRAAQLHDVGKIGIPDAVLSKQSRLTEEERALMEEHPAIGCTLLRPVRFLHPALPLIRHHHERWDGQGYPDGLQGEEIPMGARVIAAADALDAITSDRPYRQGLSTLRACAEIRNGSGTQFEPAIAHALLTAIEEHRLVVERTPEQATAG